MHTLIQRATPLVLSLLLLGAGCTPLVTTPQNNNRPAGENNTEQPALPKENPAQANARQKCATLGGESYLEISMERGEKEIFCAFKDGECTQNELNGDECFVQKFTPDQSRARTACLALDGTPRKAMSALYGEKQTFCTFRVGECTQNELNSNTCFKQKN